MIARRACLVGVMAMSAAVAGCASVRGSSGPRPALPLTSPAERTAAIMQARVWAPTDVGAMNIVAGPAGPGAFTPDETVTCDYRDKKQSGRSPKFSCVIAPDDEVKVKYGQRNGEVYGEVAASRLLWALGFGADRMYPVKVECRGCPAKIQGTAVSAIERKMAGKEIESGKKVGWAWPELELIDANAAPERRAERDALKLLAAFLQHSDSKAEQQRLLCVSDAAGPARGEPCSKTFMMVSDLGLTFGRANRFNRNKLTGVNLDRWSRAPVWKSAAGCVANLSKSWTGTLDNPSIGEPGRAFLAGLLVQLTDVQIRDLFVVSRFTLRSISDDGPPAGSTIENWVAAFKQKRDEIVNRRCLAL